MPDLVLQGVPKNASRSPSFRHPRPLGPPTGNGAALSSPSQRGRGNAARTCAGRRHKSCHGPRITSGVPAMYLARQSALTTCAVVGRHRAPGTHEVDARYIAKVEISAVRQLEPGHRPPAALSPPPSRRKSRHDLKSAAAFRITVSRTQLRHPGTAPIDDLDPDDAGPRHDRNRHRLAGSARAAVLHAIAVKLAHQQNSGVPARVPRAEHRAYKLPGHPHPLWSPGKRHGLPNRQPSHRRTRLSPPAQPRRNHRVPDGHTGMDTRLSAARQAGTCRQRGPSLTIWGSRR
jgi:hypothetical protein